MKLTRNAPSKRGRPRAFNAEVALDRAMRVFWKKGYEGASLFDLTKAMGINRPSLYAAFGNKEALFRKVVARYASGPAGYFYESLNESTARGAARRLLRSAVEIFVNPATPSGCLLVKGSLVSDNVAASLRRDLSSQHIAGEAALRERFIRARSEGDLPADADPGLLARYLIAVIYGMAVRAGSGANRKELFGIAETALSVFPARP